MKFDRDQGAAALPFAVGEDLKYGNKALVQKRVFDVCRVVLQKAPGQRPLGPEDALLEKTVRQMNLNAPFSWTPNHISEHHMGGLVVWSVELDG